MTYQLTQNSAFRSQLLLLPREQMARVIEKLGVLEDDPRPHGDLKKKLHGYEDDVYRLRCGDYRVIYTYGSGWVKLLGVDNRKDVYRGDLLVVDAPEGPVPRAPDLEDLRRAPGEPAQSRGQRDPARDVTYLPVKLDEDVLRRLRVPEEYVAPLCACRSYEDLLEVEAPPGLVERVWDAVSSPDLDRLLAGPTYLVGDPFNLMRYAEGELLGFLLKLDPEQERLVEWGLTSAGPTLVKGGPGTGKSTIALYRVRAMIRALRQSGIQHPRVLFTTYTHALERSSHQLLQQLLGPDVRCVDTRVADSLVGLILNACGESARIVSDRELLGLLRRALTAVELSENEALRAAQTKAVASLRPEYLLEEITGVIEAREIGLVDEYLQARRAGRRVPLKRVQRTVVWAVYESYRRVLAAAKAESWSGARRRALQLVRAGRYRVRYDGVVIDEAQDLDPTALRLLVALCRGANRVFITADANQSIYGASFRWSDVHEDLRFIGRTQSLQVDYRSTRQIAEAARSYLRSGALDTVERERACARDGVRPFLVRLASVREETDLLVNFLQEMARWEHVGLGSCAVLTPTNEVGGALARRLTAAGVEACFMAGRDLDLQRPGVKVITLKSAKGLEFPIVAIAGFVGAGDLGQPRGAGVEELEEWLLQERRTLFVGMTRAMRALLVVAPANGRSPQLFDGFDASLWDMGVGEASPHP